ncbi:MinD/ParA family ATP-binding protein [Rhizomonospora bruguierae]|uniref:MinD/ParA family ATP-binding protein n=1 Tax=Rhizomonospora bruguierae TaxID=1581705 RepID=UPI001BCBA5DD|nr:AAA family ATPase [Micromonospora sp. NBRC 107566]
MEGTETGWGRPAEPGPRWRALLDRALLGRTGEQEQVAGVPVVSPPEPLGPTPVSPPPAPQPGGSRRGRAAPEPPGGGPNHPGAAYGPTAPRPGTAPVPPHPAASASARPVLAHPLRPPTPPTGTPVTGMTTGSMTTGTVPPGSPTTGGRSGAPTGLGARLAATFSPGDAWRDPQAREGVEDPAFAVLRRELGGPKVLAFANPKGGVHKTTATVLAAATIGQARGRGVLAWDDNELRGTLGLRAGSARHARTIRHLIADLMEVENQHGAALLERLDDYLRHGQDATYDVLAGEENPRFAQRLDKYTVRRVLELLRRTHDVICVDTGNNVESANWQTVLQAADQLVITTVPREDAAFTADWMLDLLHEIGLGQLADNAVTLLSCPTPGHSPLLDDLSRHFATRTRAVVVVPYDPALETGSSIEYGYLHQNTRLAWLRATAVMMEPFGR